MPEGFLLSSASTLPPFRYGAGLNARWCACALGSVLLHGLALALWPSSPPPLSVPPEPLAVRLALPGPSAPAVMPAPVPPRASPARPSQSKPAPSVPIRHTTRAMALPISSPAPASPMPAAPAAAAPSAVASSSAPVASPASSGAGDNSRPVSTTPARWQAAYLHNPPPEYPWQARQRSQQGVVWLSVEVLASGQSGQVSVLRSSGVPSLDQAALRAVSRWRFVPARQGQTTVDSRVEIPIRFRLSDEDSPTDSDSAQ